MDFVLDVSSDRVSGLKQIRYILLKGDIKLDRTCISACEAIPV